MSTPSELSSESGETCRICLEPGNLIQPCNCSGSTANVHKECLERWLKTSNKTNCEICLYEYDIIRVRPQKSCKERCCFPIVFSDIPETNNSIKIVGVFGLVPLAPIAYYWGFNPIDTYFVINLIWAVLTLTYVRRMRILPTITFWKFCTAIGSLTVSFQTQVWKYTAFDGSVVLFFIIVTYMWMLIRQRRDVLIQERQEPEQGNIINIGDISTRDETINGQAESV